MKNPFLSYGMFGFILTSSANLSQVPSLFIYEKYPAHTITIALLLTLLFYYGHNVPFNIYYV